MTEIHQIKCDCCGKISNMKYDCGFYYSPSKWVQVSIIKSDLCPKCYKMYKAKNKEFIKKNCGGCK